jgi:UDP-N-acetylmuramoylalanine-D-glutamate ligase
MKNTHFLLAAQESDVSKTYPKAFLAKIEGKNATTVKEFFDAVALAMHFEEEPLKNLEAFDAMLNDLEWIKEEQIIIYINDSAAWLSKEKSEEKILSIIDVLDATAEDWKWLDEDEDTAKKDLKIIFQESPRIKSILEEQEIPFSELGR